MAKKTKTLDKLVEKEKINDRTAKKVEAIGDVIYPSSFFCYGDPVQKYKKLTPEELADGISKVLYSFNPIYR